MINKIYIETESRNVYPERDILGISGENKFETLQFNLDSFIDGQALLRVERKETSGTAKYEIAVQKEDNCYTLEVLSSLLMYKGLIKMQLVIMQENLEVFKSKTFNMKVLEEIEGAQEIPEQYPTWQQLANQKIIEMNNKITEVTALEEDLEDKVESGYFKGEKGETGQIDEQAVTQAVQSYFEQNPVQHSKKTSDLINDSDFVSDSNYVHTDNNYTTEEKQKLAGLSNYDDTEVKQSISDLSNLIGNIETLMQEV